MVWIVFIGWIVVISVCTLIDKKNQDIMASCLGIAFGWAWPMLLLVWVIYTLYAGVRKLTL